MGNGSDRGVVGNSNRESDDPRALEIAGDLAALEGEEVEVTVTRRSPWALSACVTRMKKDPVDAGKQGHEDSNRH